MKTSAIILYQAQLSTDPTTPASGYGVIYPKSDGKWYAKNSAGTVTEITNVAGGADPWTYLKVTSSDFTTSSNTAVNITGLSFTPAANTDYEVEVCLMAQTPTATVGVRPGFSWGTGYSYGVVDIYTPSSGTAESIIHATIGTSAGSALAAVGGLPTTGAPYGHRALIAFRSGATPTAFNAQVASETNGTTITVKIGSFMKYRTI